MKSEIATLKFTRLVWKYKNDSYVYLYIYICKTNNKSKKKNFVPDGLYN